MYIPKLIFILFLFLFHFSSQKDIDVIKDEMEKRQRDGDAAFETAMDSRAIAVAAATQPAPKVVAC